MRIEETHPWHWFVSESSRYLIIGTFPTAKGNWKYDFFYPNPSNLFWTVMANIAGLELFYFSGDKAVIERKEILMKLKIGITDIGKKVIRNDNSSLDEKLIPIEYTDILKIIEENPPIEKLILTSSSGKVCATNWFSNYLLEHKLSVKILKGPKSIKNKLSLNQKEIQIVTLYSTSRRAANRITLDKLVELYKAEIL
jgi:G:T/U-mismatch repair DNA glycosylase